VPAQHAIRGLASVTITVRDIESSATFMERLLGFRRGDSEGEGLVMQIGPGGLGAQIRLLQGAALPSARVGIGGVHHVAFRTPDDAEHREWQANLAAAHVGVTDVIDRYYFRSIYFREPGGVLFEIATDGPGFTGDEDIEHLGERLSLPPFLEARRPEIESQLTPLDTAPPVA
jgi:glyoxalase family protein